MANPVRLHSRPHQLLDRSAVQQFSGLCCSRWRHEELPQRKCWGQWWWLGEQQRRRWESDGGCPIAAGMSGLNFEDMVDDDIYEYGKGDFMEHA
ncbi:uncharacterized protein J3R85_019315 [Psidium guajava]|nr:uncharacterized protein J3R85_019315 [Psidium guajava]